MTYRPITDIWFLARAKLKGGVKRYGCYLGGFPERARVLLGAAIDDPVLHICGGLARFYPYAGGFGPYDCTLDLDPATEPDFLFDVRLGLPVSTGGIEPKRFRHMLADPPYSEDDATKYAPGRESYPTPNTIIRQAMAALPIGGRVGLIHYSLPACPKNAKFIAAVGIMCGFNNRIRCFSVFERRA